MDKKPWGFHLFGANFASDEEAKLYAFEQWEPKPPATSSAAEYSDWEDRNPTWRMADELEFNIDSDFVELPGGLERVVSQISSPAERAEAIAKCAPFTHFIMIGTNRDAMWHDRRSRSSQVEPVTRLPESTGTITYLGEYNC